MAQLSIIRIVVLNIADLADNWSKAHMETRRWPPRSEFEDKYLGDTRQLIMREIDGSGEATWNRVVIFELCFP